LGKKVIFNRLDRFLGAAIKLKLVILGKMNVTVTFFLSFFQKQLQHDNKNTMLKFKGLKAASSVKAK